MKPEIVFSDWITARDTLNAGNADIMQALDDGEVDYAICHGSIANNIMKENDLNVVECFELMDSYPSIGVREELTELHDELNKVLQEMADDGTIQKYENKWVNSSMNHKSLGNVIKGNLQT